MNQYRQHYQPAQRASFARDFLQALIMAALIGAPFAVYFWSMTS